MTNLDRILSLSKRWDNSKYMFFTYVGYDILKLILIFFIYFYICGLKYAQLIKALKVVKMKRNLLSWHILLVLILIEDKLYIYYVYSLIDIMKKSYSSFIPFLDISKIPKKLSDPLSYENINWFLKVIAQQTLLKIPKGFKKCSLSSLLSMYKI